MSDSFNIVLAGVGGQGTLLAGKLFGLVAARLGLDVKVSEVHGMAQRGGSVITYVRIGKRVFSPVIEPGAADFIIAFEELEAMRWAHLLRRGGTLLINTRRTIPMPVAMGQAEYPDNIIESILALADGGTSVHAFDAQRLAEEAGSVKAVNFVMTGALSRFIKIDKQIFMDSIQELFSGKKAGLAAMNQHAFELGSAIIEAK
ncbi:MAG: indolepyruvate ferredoxin oxidoreductase, beta subunit [Clostridiales bacterium]|jgi:indolepyruvate ferredoxin oxidoreductase beta subunit|nr:indolepyruvate oxidoreductase subunit beta [Eubacteriales bacterium]MDN5315524.1 indolepyruvate ferredoxin oxidoreductase, beta subunit [Clostridiales bacterium]